MYLLQMHYWRASESGADPRRGRKEADSCLGQGRIGLVLESGPIFAIFGSHSRLLGIPCSLQWSRGWGGWQSRCATACLTQPSQRHYIFCAGGTSHCHIASRHLRPGQGLLLRVRITIIMTRRVKFEIARQGVAALWPSGAAAMCWLLFIGNQCAAERVTVRDRG